MIIRLIKTASAQPNSELIKFWLDDFGNVLSIFSISGKKYGLMAKPKEDPLSWKVFMGVAANKSSEELPVGIAEYIYGEDLSQENSEELTEFFKSKSPQGVRIPNGQGVSWSPQNEQEKNGLIKLVDMFGSINKELKANGILYSSGDKDLFGEDVTSKNVIDWWSSDQESATSKPQTKEFSGKPASDMSDSLFGGVTPKWNYDEPLGASHANRKLGNWESDNAIDIFAPVGTPIYSLSDGTVSRVRASSSGPKIYGTQISVSGKDGYPNLFYTHTDNPQVSDGDPIRVGELLAYVGQPSTKEMPPHLHLGIETGSLASLVSKSGKIVGSKRKLSSRELPNIRKISSRV